MPESLESASPLFRFYHGRSMRHTFRSGDCIYFKSVPLESLRAGDVIVYSGEDSGSEDVIHRILKVGSSFLLTRGDNNSYDEIEKICLTRILGKAIYYERSGSRRKVTGGFAGEFRARLLNRAGVIRLSVRKVYSLLRKSGIVRLFWKPKITTISISTDPASVVRLLHRGKTIGKFCRDQRKLSLRKPYDLVIKMKDLSS